MINELQTQRLLDVATALRETPKALGQIFSMRKFGYGQEDCMLPDDVSHLTPESCGSPACALGHYAVRRDMQHKFKLSRFGQLTNNKGVTISFNDDAILDHFGLDLDEAYRLFSAEGCMQAKTPIQAARYIERFLSSQYGWTFNKTAT